jgi:hypothetical protein
VWCVLSYIEYAVKNKVSKEKERRFEKKPKGKVATISIPFMAFRRRIRNFKVSALQFFTLLLHYVISGSRNNLGRVETL